MKIISVEAFAVQAKPIDRQAYWGSRTWGEASVGRPAEISAEYPSPVRRRFVYSKTIDTCLVRITTDDGLIGYGEAKAPVAPQVTKAIIDLLLADVVLGADARDITVLWERMYAGMRVRGHQAGFYLEAISGIDIALWDLAGKAANCPYINYSVERSGTRCASTLRDRPASICTTSRNAYLRSALDAPAPPREDAMKQLICLAAKACGVGTLGDIASYFYTDAWHDRSPRVPRW